MTTAVVECIRCRKVYKALKVVADRREKLAGVCPECRRGPSNSNNAGVRQTLKGGSEHKHSDRCREH